MKLAILNQSSLEGQTPLMIAVQHSPKATKLLCQYIEGLADHEKVAILTRKDVSGWSALMLGAANSSFDLQPFCKIIDALEDKSQLNGLFIELNESGMALLTVVAKQNPGALTALFYYMQTLDRSVKIAVAKNLSQHGVWKNIVYSFSKYPQNIAYFCELLSHLHETDKQWIMESQSDFYLSVALEKALSCVPEVSGQFFRLMGSLDKKRQTKAIMRVDVYLSHHHGGKSNLLMMGARCMPMHMGSICALLRPLDMTDKFLLFRQTNNEWQNALAIAVSHCPKQIAMMCQLLIPFEPKYKLSLKNLLLSKNISDKRERTGNLLLDLLSTREFAEESVNAILDLIGCLDPKDIKILLKQENREGRNAFELICHQKGHAIEKVCGVLSKLDKKSQQELLLGGRIPPLLLVIQNSPRAAGFMLALIANMDKARMSAILIKPSHNKLNALYLAAANRALGVKICELMDSLDLKDRITLVSECCERGNPLLQALRSQPDVAIAILNIMQDFNPPSIKRVMMGARHGAETALSLSLKQKSKLFSMVVGYLKTSGKELTQCMLSALTVEAVSVLEKAHEGVDEKIEGLLSLIMLVPQEERESLPIVPTLFEIICKHKPGEEKKYSKLLYGQSQKPSTPEQARDAGLEGDRKKLSARSSQFFPPEGEGIKGREEVKQSKLDPK
jgi:hypothetical protein